MILIRHTEAEDAYAGRCYGSLDVALSPTGHQQAGYVADQLSDQRIDLVLSSPRRRALATAEPVAVRRGLTIRVVDELRELDFGQLEGRSYKEIERSMPELWQEWMTRPTALRFPGGESYDDLRLRVCPAVDTVRREHPAQTVAVVAHGGVLRALLADALGLAPANIFRLDQRYGAINIIDWFDDTPVVRIVNG